MNTERIDRTPITDLDEARRAVQDGIVAASAGPGWLTLPLQADYVLDALRWGDLRDSRQRAVDLVAEVEAENALLRQVLAKALGLLQAWDGPLAPELVVVVRDGRELGVSPQL